MGRPNVNWSVGNATEKHSTYTSKAVKAGIPFASQVTEPNTKYIIKYDFNLGGESVEIPENCILEFQGGSVSNGTLVGDGTQICAEKVAIFSAITIDGEWNVPEITTSWFSDCQDDNKLRDVFALTNPLVNNDVSIESGDYYVYFTPEDTTGFYVYSNTCVKIIGTIHLKFVDESITSSRIIWAEGENIHFSGGGKIIGDKDLHPSYDASTYISCILIRLGGCVNSSVKNLSFEKSVGSCISVGRQCRNVTIENIVIDDFGSNGIAFTDGDNLTIANCLIKNGNLRPGNGIDIEPGKPTETLRNVTIDNCVFDSVRSCVNIYNRHGINCENIDVKNCKMYNVDDFCIHVNGDCKNIVIDNCIGVTKYRTVLIYEIVGMEANLIVNNCHFTTEYDETKDYDAIENRRTYISSSSVLMTDCVINDDYGNFYVASSQKTNFVLKNSRIKAKSISINNSDSYIVDNTIVCDGFSCTNGKNTISSNIITTKETNYLRGSISGNTFESAKVDSVVTGTDFIKLYPNTSFMNNKVREESSEDGDCKVYTMLTTLGSNICLGFNTFFTGGVQGRNIYLYTGSGDSNPKNVVAIFNIEKPSSTYPSVSSDFITVNNAVSASLLSNNPIKNKYYGTDVPSGSVLAERGEMIFVSKFKMPAFYYNQSAGFLDAFGHKLESHNGSTRPTLRNNDDVGFMFFDTALTPARPIYWNGTTWVDSTGTTV